MKKVAILGTVGIPAAYGGFETLAENLVDYAAKHSPPANLTVYCSGRSGPPNYSVAKLRYIPIKANGASSIFYDVISMLSAMLNKEQVFLVLGVSGAIALPVVRALSSGKIITNIDGVEWKREKWSRVAKAFLRFSEYLAVRFSHVVIADNQAIADHIHHEYNSSCKVIAYGGDHATNVKAKDHDLALPSTYALALCRVEPENNVDMILKAFANSPLNNLVFIGNWESSSYGRRLRSTHKRAQNIYMLDPIYDLGVLKTIRTAASAYIHGHSAGGTNPSLVEMMHFGAPIYAYDCKFNRYTTNNEAIYFTSSSSLIEKLNAIPIQQEQNERGLTMSKLAQQKYSWKVIGKQYFSLMT